MKIDNTQLDGKKVILSGHKTIKKILENDHALLTEGTFRKMRDEYRAKKRMNSLWKDGKVEPQIKKILSEKDGK